MLLKGFDMKGISIELFNQNDPVEFEKFRNQEAAAVFAFCDEVIQDKQLSDKIRDAIFEIVRMAEPKDFKNYSDLKLFLTKTANNKLFEYKQYEKLKPQ